MKRVSALFLALLLFLTGCQEAAPSNDGTEDGSDHVAEGDGSVDTEEKGENGNEEEGSQKDSDDENIQDGAEEIEKEENDYMDIPTVKVGALDVYDMILEGFALETLLPRKWTFEYEGAGKYSIFRDGALVGNACSGAASLSGWQIVSEEEFECDTGVIIDAFIEKSLEMGGYRRRLRFSLREAPWVYATICVSYEQLDENTMYRLWRESQPSAIKNYPNFDYLYDIDEGESVLILGNSFVSSSRIGFILSQMCENAPFSVGVEAVSRGYAQVGTYTSDAAVMQSIREGQYGCVFICGFYSEGEIANLKLLKEACDASDTMLVIFPAHNENAIVIQRAIDSDETLYYLPWRDEINALINAGVDFWDMCINDMHKHSTPLAGYVGAHMIYRAIFGEVPGDVYISDEVNADTIKEKLGETYVTTGVLCGDGKSLTFP